ncbi:hypothetical protein STEG23_008332 [Scotinomys teguina]
MDVVHKYNTKYIPCFTGEVPGSWGFRRSTPERLRRQWSLDPLDDASHSFVFILIKFLLHSVWTTTQIFSLVTYIFISPILGI